MTVCANLHSATAIVACVCLLVVSWLGAGSTQEVRSAGTMDGQDVQIAHTSPIEGSKGVFVLLRRVGSQWQVDDVSSSPMGVPDGAERLYVLPKSGNRILVSPSFEQFALYPDTTLFACSLNWPHGRGYSPCESAFATNAWSAEGLSGGQRDLDRDEIARAVAQSGVVRVALRHVARR
jgi:hypothetical protein